MDIVEIFKIKTFLDCENYHVRKNQAANIKPYLLSVHRLCSQSDNRRRGADVYFGKPRHQNRSKIRP